MRALEEKFDFIFRIEYTNENVNYVIRSDKYVK